MILLNVFYHLPPENEESFIEAVAAENILELTRAEDGCLKYELYSSLDSEGELILVEHWRDEAALESHKNQPHFALLQEIKAKLVEKTDIEKYTV